MAELGIRKKFAPKQKCKFQEDWSTELVCVIVLTMTRRPVSESNCLSFSWNLSLNP